MKSALLRKFLDICDVPGWRRIFVKLLRISNKLIFYYVLFFCASVVSKNELELLLIWPSTVSIICLLYCVTLGHFWQILKKLFQNSLFFKCDWFYVHILSLRTYTSLESIYLALICSYTRYDHKKVFDLGIFTVLCLFWPFYNKNTFVPGWQNMIFLKLYRQDCGVKISIESIICFYYSKCFCSAINKSGFVVNIKLLPLYT